MTRQEVHQLKVLTQELLDRHKIGDLLTACVARCCSNGMKSDRLTITCCIGPLHVCVFWGCRDAGMLLQWITWITNFTQVSSRKML